MTTVNLGGDRLGSGNKMNISLKNFERSTFNKSSVWRSTMAVGTLTPFLCDIGLPGDSWQINLNAMLRTLPTIQPLYGSAKLQLDVFMIPMRLYQSGLHMNLQGIGMKMKDIKLPLISLYQWNNKKYSQSCLQAYLGVRGAPQNSQGGLNFYFRKLGLPTLCYYEIYAKYYANKQEGIGYVISQADLLNYSITSIKAKLINDAVLKVITFDANGKLTTNWGNEGRQVEYLEIEFTGSLNNNIDLSYEVINALGDHSPLITTALSNISTITNVNATTRRFTFIGDIKDFTIDLYELYPIVINNVNTNIALKSFDLNNIDQMRLSILKHDYATPFVISHTSPEPYSLSTGNTPTSFTNQYTMNGLAIKTYQSDIFNNWLSTEWIDGIGGINELTALDTTSGSIKLDTINFAKKVYNILASVAVSGGSYEDWQVAVYGEDTLRKAETPIYVGGMSSEVVFDEVVSTAATELNGEKQELGSLAGRGTLNNKKGGYIDIRVNEACILMGLVSITPRIDYAQGSKWWSNLQSMDDLHKPELGGIGFQELITEQMHHEDCEYNPTTHEYKFRSAGKQPAWLNYQTDYNEVYGQFAEVDDENFRAMTFQRRYEMENGRIKDLTTYIDPAKFNYAFAGAGLDAQNFMVQISKDILVRRKMSSKIMPNW